MVDGTSLRAKRKRLGLSQEAVAKRVRELSGERFSQQALAKFESGKDAKSAFCIYIIDALSDLERELLPDDVAMIREPSPRFITREKPEEKQITSLAGDLSTEEFIAMVEKYAARATLTPEQRLRIVAVVSGALADRAS